MNKTIKHILISLGWAFVLLIGLMVKINHSELQDLRQLEKTFKDYRLDQWKTDHPPKFEVGEWVWYSSIYHPTTDSCLVINREFREYKTEALGDLGYYKDRYTTFFAPRYTYTVFRWKTAFEVSEDLLFKKTDPITISLTF